jgi:hypothetical protein
MDPDPSVFITDLQDANKKLILKKVFLYITFLRYLYIIFKDKKSKRCHKTVEIKVLYYICLMLKGSKSGSGSGRSCGSGSESGSGSGTLKVLGVEKI